MTWTERIEQVRDFFDYEAVDMEKRANSAIADTILQCLFLYGPRRAAELAAPLHARIPSIVAHELKGVPADHPVLNAVMWIASAVNAYEIVGLAIAPEVLASFRPYLPRIELDREYPFCQWNKGLLAIALDEPIWVAVAGHMEIDDVPWQPGAQFGPNVQGLIGHLGAARAHGAGFAEVAAAWHAFMDNADFLVDKMQINYETIAWVARVVLHDIGKRPLGEVGAALRAEIERCMLAGT
jgi:hypothetical protein